MPVIGDPVGLTVDRILLATDFSPASEAAGAYAKGLARRFSSTLTLANVVESSTAPHPEDSSIALSAGDQQRTSSENLERILTDLTFEGVRAVAHEIEGRNPAASIVGLADTIHADLIVTGTHSRSGFTKAVLGSCAEGIIRHAKCPVLTVGPRARKPPQGPFSFSSIIFATDFSADAARKASVALAFAQDNTAKIYLCHILEHPGRDVAQTLEQQLKFETALHKLIPQSTYDWCSPECLVEHGSVAPHLVEMANLRNADLIVLGARRSASWFAHLVDGVVAQVLAAAPCPVMTIASV